MVYKSYKSPVRGSSVVRGSGPVGASVRASVSRGATDRPSDRVDRLTDRVE